VEAVDLGGQNEIAPRPVDLMRPGRDLNSAPGKEDVQVVRLLLRKLIYAIYNPRAPRKTRSLTLSPRPSLPFELFGRQRASGESEFAGAKISRRSAQNPGSRFLGFTSSYIRFSPLEGVRADVEQHRDAQWKFPPNWIRTPLL